MIPTHRARPVDFIISNFKMISILLKALLEIVNPGSGCGTFGKFTACDNGVIGYLLISLIIISYFQRFCIRYNSSSC